MKKGNFSAFLSGIKKKPFLIPNVEKSDVVLDCTRVLSAPLWYKEVVEKICLGDAIKKELYIGYYLYSLYIYYKINIVLYTKMVKQKENGNFTFAPHLYS